MMKWTTVNEQEEKEEDSYVILNFPNETSDIEDTKVHFFYKIMEYNINYIDSAEVCFN